MTIHSAAEAGNINELKALLSSNPEIIASTDEMGNQPLNIAAWQGKKKAVEFLLDAGADINARGDLGRTPLHYAIHECYKGIAEFLLRRGASPDIKDNAGFSPLYYAAATNDIPTAKKMIKAGAHVDLNSRIFLDGPEAVLDDIRNSPNKVHPEKEDLPTLVCDAALAGSEKLALAFAKMGVDPNANVGGESLFLTMIPYHYFDLIKLLVEGGANLEAHASSGMSVLDFCEMCQSDERVIKLITENMPS